MWGGMAVAMVLQRGPSPCRRLEHGGQRWLFLPLLESHCFGREGRMWGKSVDVAVGVRGHVSGKGHTPCSMTSPEVDRRTVDLLKRTLP